jgi:40S ribosome biogenesis protein Tsr1 and BMS1 C-terminal
MARPIFSSDEPNADKHKMERFLHDGRQLVATVYGPICYPQLPLLAFHVSESGPVQLAATGKRPSHARPPRAFPNTCIVPIGTARHFCPPPPGAAAHLATHSPVCLPASLGACPMRASSRYVGTPVQHLVGLSVERG